MARLTSRPQDHLGAPITVALAEISNDEPHRKDSKPDPELIAALQSGARFGRLLCARSPSGRLLLLGGERRFNALKEIGRTNVPIYVARDVNGLLGWLQLDSATPGKRMLRSEVGAYTAKAQFLLHITTRDIGKVDQMLGTVHDYSWQTVQLCRQLVNRISSLRPGPEWDRAIEDLDLVDRGILRPSSAVGRYIERQKKAAWVAASLPANEQAAVLTRVMPGLRGTCEALVSMGSMSPELPAELRAQAVKELTAASRQMARIVKSLKQGESA